MVVSSEQLLNAWSFKLCNRLLHLLCIGVLPLRVSVLGIKIVLTLRRNKWRVRTFVKQLVPVIVLEPFMVLKVLGTVQPKSVGRFSLY